MADDDLQGTDLSAVIAEEISRARNAADATTADTGKWGGKRELAAYYMRGEMPDLPARAGGSTQTSRDFADAVSWILPGIVRVFTASDQMVKYDKVKAENDDWSQDASEYTNHSFFAENDGYRVLYNCTHDALTQGDGVVVSYWEPERVEAKTFRDQTDMELAALLDEGWAPTGQVKQGKPKTDLVDDPVTGEAVEAEVPTLTVRLQKVERPGKICDRACKPENLLLNPGATTIEDARFCAYLHDDKTRSDLMDLADDYGWDKSIIEQLGADSPSTSVAGDARDGANYTDDTSPFRSGDAIELYECYFRYDQDGDGVAELVQGWFAGNNGKGAMLGEPEEWEGDNPYTMIPCYPVPHQAHAESLFDRMADIARVKTTLLRQGLDNTYWVNLPMREADAGSVLNPDILVSQKFGGIIWKKPATNPIVPHVVPYTADKSFAAMEYMDEMGAKRTGISRTSMALDPEALQNQTATATQQQRDAATSQTELIARNMAELGWAKWARKRMRLAIRHKVIMAIPSKRQPQQGQSSGFREINAGQWDPNMAVTINVGLGTGSRDKDVAMLNSVLMNQFAMADRLGAAGLKAKAVEFIPKILKTAVQIAESAGLKNPDEYYPSFTDKDTAQAQQMVSQPQPDPAVQLEHMKGEVQKQLKAADGQITLQVEAGKNQLAAQQAEIESAAQVRREDAQMQADLITKQADRETQVTLKLLDRETQVMLKDMDIAYQREKDAQAAQLQREGMMNTASIADRNNAAKAEQAKSKPNGAG